VTKSDQPTTIAGRYQVTGLIGTFGDRGPCDAPDATRYPGGCTCIVCARCGNHTGNSNQGHYWAHCKVTKTKREFHLCCPGDCELEAVTTITGATSGDGA
jgi:hypothetical protein